MNASFIDTPQIGEPQLQPRKLIVCIDGTSNQFSKKNTHVVELYSRIRKDSSQLTYYNSGIGTYARPFMWSFTYQKQRLFNVIDLAIAWNFEKVILAAYRWLADVYQPGDQIFLFGFSRGAYQVQTLAAMIHKVGLIHPGNQEQIPFAWAVYSNDDNAKKFKKAFCRSQVDLHFVGVWDAVASVGMFPRKPFPLMDQRDYITHFRHALALDECRVKFLPEHIPTRGTQTSKEVWFAGTHSDIGGGNRDNSELNRGGEPLKWMMEEAYKLGLSIRLHDVKIGIPSTQVTDSMGWIWLILEILPIPWMKYLPDGKSVLSRFPHLMRPREVLRHQSIHWTVGASIARAQRERDSKGPGYSPRAKIMKNQDKPSDWDLRFGVKWVDWKYMDLTEMLRNDDKPYDNKWFERLRDYTICDEGVPEAIWAYGGPQLLQKLFDQFFEAPNRQHLMSITRAIVGFDDRIPWDKGSEEKCNGTVNYRSEGERKSNMNSKERGERLHDMVIPRICLLLKEWLKEDGKHEPEGCFASFLRMLGLKVQKHEDVEVKWSWYWIPKETRSVPCLISVIDIVSQIANIPGIEQASVERMARRTAEIMCNPVSKKVDRQPNIQKQSEEESGELRITLAQVQLKTMEALLKHDVAEKAFRDGSILLAFLPLLFDEKSEGADRAIEITRLYTTKIANHKHAVVVEKLVDYLNDKEEKMRRAACKMLVILLDNRWCYFTLDQPKVLQKLFNLAQLQGQTSRYTNEALQAVLKTPTRYSYTFSWRPIDEQVDHWNYIIRNMKNYLNGNEAMVKASARLICTQMSLSAAGPMTGGQMDDLGRLLKHLAQSLANDPISQPSKTARLSIVTRFGLSDFRATHEDLESLSGAVESVLKEVTRLAETESDSQNVVLAVLSLCANLKPSTERQELLYKHADTLMSMLTLEDPDSLQDALELLDILLRKGYKLVAKHEKHVVSFINGLKKEELSAIQRRRARLGADRSLVSSIKLELGKTSK